VRGEETITDDLLLNISRAHPGEVLTFQFTKPHEKNTGADWEWWLTDGSLWFGLLIQAKRLDPKTHKYQQLRKRVGKRKTPQIDLLIEQARVKGIDPLYFFYNYSRSGASAFKWYCGSTPLDLHQLGCTVAHAAAVKGLPARGGTGLNVVSPISFPLRCLVCCPVLSDPPNSLPGCAHGIVKQLRDSSEKADALSHDRPSLRKEPPDYVRRLFDSPPEQRADVVESLRKEVGPIGSLVVIKDRQEG
jgi:hypothetical protein